MFRLMRKLISAITDKGKIREIDYESSALLAEYFKVQTEKRIIEVCNNIFTKREDWVELLIICEYSDLWFRETHPNIEFDSLKESALEYMPQMQ
jgi:hypothetical protein